jgi:hypothetical protein
MAFVDSNCGDRVLLPRDQLHTLLSSKADGHRLLRVSHIPEDPFPKVQETACAHDARQRGHRDAQDVPACPLLCTDRCSLPSAMGTSSQTGRVVSSDDCHRFGDRRRHLLGGARETRRPGRKHHEERHDTGHDREQHVISEQVRACEQGVDEFP